GNVGRRTQLVALSHKRGLAPPGPARRCCAARGAGAMIAVSRPRLRLTCARDTWLNDPDTRRAGVRAAELAAGRSCPPRGRAAVARQHAALPRAPLALPTRGNGSAAPGAVSGGGLRRRLRDARGHARRPARP